MQDAVIDIDTGISPEERERLVSMMRERYDKSYAEALFASTQGTAYKLGWEAAIKMVAEQMELSLALN